MTQAIPSAWAASQVSRIEPSSETGPCTTGIPLLRIEVGHDFVPDQRMKPGQLQQPPGEGRHGQDEEDRGIAGEHHGEPAHQVGKVHALGAQVDGHVPVGILRRESLIGMFMAGKNHVGVRGIQVFPKLL